MGSENFGRQQEAEFDEYKAAQSAEFKAYKEGQQQELANLKTGPEAAHDELSLEIEKQQQQEQINRVIENIKNLALPKIEELGLQESPDKVKKMFQLATKATLNQYPDLNDQQVADIQSFSSSYADFVNNQYEQDAQQESALEQQAIADFGNLATERLFVYAPDKTGEGKGVTIIRNKQHSEEINQHFDSYADAVSFLESSDFGLPPKTEAPVPTYDQIPSEIQKQIVADAMEGMKNLSLEEEQSLKQEVRTFISENGGQMENGEHAILDGYAIMKMQPTKAGLVFQKDMAANTLRKHISNEGGTPKGGARTLNGFAYMPIDKPQ